MEDETRVSRLALYRKYRSTDLSEVVGQEHITKTLDQSLKSGQISHAYLFTGPRGVGKTSVARILARRVNNLDSTKDTALQLDIIEIDAASNRGIDEIRSLREKINSSPTNLKYKVYIIDEAHMLTREAFNALLKTLEEPPPHVLFILATTEAHKLPDTIISRTQRYDFRPFSEDTITKHLGVIAKSEKIDITEDGLQTIAELSDGGMRDAISLLDQLSVFNEKIDANFVSQRMGLANSKQIALIIDAASQNDVKTALDTLANQISDGVEPRALNSQIQRFLRNILLSTDKDLEYEQSFVIRALDLFCKAEQQFKITSHHSLPIEIAIVKLSITTSTGQSVAGSEISTPQLTPNVTRQNKSKQQTVSKNELSSEATVEDIDLTSRCAKGMSIIKEHNNSLYALLRSGNAHIKDKSLIVDCRFNFHKERIEEHRNREMIEKVMSRVCGQPINLVCLLNQVDTKEPIKEDDELVSSAMAILGGELVDG